MQTLQFAFSNLGLHRIFLKVRKDNTAAIKVYTACGFTEEGVLREDVYKQGEFKDVLICLLYTSDAADERSSVDLGVRRIIKKKENKQKAEGS